MGVRHGTRLHRLERIAGCPDCQPQVVRIVEVIVQSHEEARRAIDAESQVPTGRCLRCGRPVPVVLDEAEG